MHCMLRVSLSIHQLDWLVPDRVIDVPVYQDVLAWGEHDQASRGDLIKSSCASETSTVHL